MIGKIVVYALFGVAAFGTLAVLLAAVIFAIEAWYEWKLTKKLMEKRGTAEAKDDEQAA